MKPVLLELWGLQIHTLGAFIVLGTLGAGLTYYSLAKKRALKTSHIFDSVLYILLVGLVVGRLGYFALNSEKWANWWKLIIVWQGGISVLPAIVAGLIAAILIIKKHREPLWTSLDIISLAALVGWTIGKVGCQLSSCTVGKPWTGFLAVDGLYPVDLIGGIWALATFGFLVWLWSKTKRLIEGVVFFLTVESLLIGNLIFLVIRADYGSDATRLESIVYLILIVITYFIFWALHGPGLSLVNRFKRRKLDK